MQQSFEALPAKCSRRSTVRRQHVAHSRGGTELDLRLRGSWSANWQRTSSSTATDPTWSSSWMSPIPTGGEWKLSAACRPHQVMCSSRSRGRLLQQTSPPGRGLGIVRHLMDEIVTDTTDGQVSIRCRRHTDRRFVSGSYKRKERPPKRPLLQVVRFGRRRVC